jgi:thiol:disulfide interchange protein DsbA
MMRLVFGTVFALALTACGQEPNTAVSNDSAMPSAAGIAAASAPVTELAQADSEEFRAGVDYEMLSPAQPTTAEGSQIEVTEMFWYGCPHCYAFEPFIEDWLSRKADYIHFVRVPVVWNPVHRLHAQAHYTAEVLGKLDEMHKPLFDEIHRNGNFLDTEQALVEFFGRFGVSADAFNAAFNSTEVQVKLQEADEIGRRYRIRSVPSIVVNGKYSSNGSTAGGYDRLLRLVDQLAATEHDAR